MSRIPKIKELNNTRLACSYGGWIYCEGCNQTIGYLCYVTYDSFFFEYKCKCGSSGNMLISFNEETKAEVSGQSLITIKNRLCCPNDDAPLFTLLTKKLAYYKYEVLCSGCGTMFVEEQKL